MVSIPNMNSAKARGPCSRCSSSFNPITGRRGGEAEVLFFLLRAKKNPNISLAEASFLASSRHAELFAFCTNDAAGAALLSDSSPHCLLIFFFLLFLFVSPVNSTCCASAGFCAVVFHKQPASFSCRRRVSPALVLVSGSVRKFETHYNTACFNVRVRAVEFCERMMSRVSFCNATEPVECH